MIYKKLLNSKNLNPGYYGVTATIVYLREMFNQNLDLGFQVYDDNLNKEESYSSLIITSKYDWETKYRSKRPAIFVSRGNLISGVNGTQGQGKLFSITDNGAETSYLDLISFPIVVECLSESDIECEALSSIVSLFLAADARPLRSLGFQIATNPSQSPPQLFEKGNVSFISSVILQINMHRNIKTRILNDQLLKEFNIKVNNALNIDVK